MARRKGNRAVRLTVLLSAQESKWLQELAMSEWCTMSDYIRKHIWASAHLHVLEGTLPTESAHVEER